MYNKLLFPLTLIHKMRITKQITEKSTKKGITKLGNYNVYQIEFKIKKIL